MGHSRDVRAATGPYVRRMTLRTDPTPLDQRRADRLSAAFHRCFSDFTAEPGTFAPDAFFDLLPPMWRFQLQGSGEVFAHQLHAIAEGPVEIEILRTIPT